MVTRVSSLFESEDMISSGKCLLWTVMLGIVMSSQAREASDCYTLDNNPYIMFATKTAYHYIYGRPRQKSLEIPDCEPVQYWMLARHGTRYPGTQTIRAMQQLQTLATTIVQNHEDRKSGRLCYNDVDRLKVWTLNVTHNDAKMLTIQGKNDLYEMAKRVRSNFPTLFDKEYASNLYEFRHTHTDRTRQSAQAFAEGMFGTGETIAIPPPIKNDSIIKPYENCTAWMRHVRNDRGNMREAHLYTSGLDMITLVRNVSNRLGFGYELPIDTVFLMYDMCRYDKAWNLHLRSAWCAVFSREELQVLEYGEDLKNFYEAGYGHPMNLRLGCAPIKDMLLRFSQLEYEDTSFELRQPFGVFYFTHSDMLAMALARLGIANHGKAMRHDNFPEQKNREWSTSNLIPFAANLAAVFYKCNHGERNRVMFLLNERVMDFPGCTGGLCSWQDIKERYMDIPNTCDLLWCSAAVSLQYALLLMTLLLAFTQFM